MKCKKCGEHVHVGQCCSCKVTNRKKERELALGNFGRWNNRPKRKKEDDEHE
jgi:hypothetical protein